MSLRSSGAAARRLAAALTCLAAGAAAQELPAIVETVDVRVVNVDVVVTDAEGRPVRGLERDDFELLVDGRPVTPDYFSAVADGRTVASATSEAGPAALPYLAIVYDGRSLRPARVRRAIDSLVTDLHRLLAKTESIMVLRQGTSLVVEQPMTRDIDLLSAALERLARRRTPALDVGDRQLLLQQIEGLRLPQALRETESDLISRSEDDIAIQQAQHLLRQIRIQAEVERRAAEASARQLNLLARSMAGLPGRKAILLLGQGLQRRPAEALYRLWWERFSRYASRIGLVSIDAEIGQVRSDGLVDRLIDEANAHRVTFYGHDPTGLAVIGGSAEYASSETTMELARENEQMREALLDLSLATGGIGRVWAADIRSLLDEMLDGFGSYYSLGFTPQGIERGQVRVRLRRPGLRVRYLKRFAARSGAQELEEATLATLLTAAENNRLQVGIELGEAELQEDGTYLVPLLIKVPMARLTLLPQRSHHVGRVSFVVISQSADGGLSQPATGEVPIEIANAELVSALARVAGYRLRLRTGGGEQIVAIGVRDEVARQDATLRLVLRPGQGA